jgi:hypothetical protein
MTAGATIDTVVGSADVLHRLALAVECLDAVTGQRVRADLSIDREVDPLLLPPSVRGLPPLRPLEARDSGRALIRFDHTTPTRPVRLRIWDPRRRYAPRRLDLPLWTLAEVVAAEATPRTVPAASRTLRPRLFPGSAGPVPRGATVIRGRVQSGGAPVRWARVSAVRTGDVPIGHGHADDRGEFVVVLADAGNLPPPAPSELSVDLVVTAPDPNTAPQVDPADALADLVAEALARPSNPPLPAELDNDVLRGVATPAGYVANTAALPTLTVPTGTALTLTDPITFAA